MSGVPQSPRMAALMAHITNLQRETQTKIRRVSEEFEERITLVEMRDKEPIPHHDDEENESEEEIPKQERRTRRHDRRHRHYDNEMIEEIDTMIVRMKGGIGITVMVMTMNGDIGIIVMRRIGGKCGRMNIGRERNSISPIFKAKEMRNCI